MFGSTMVGLANHLSLMILGRILIGLGCGLATVTVPLFLAEIAPPSIKKSLGIMNQLFIVFGMLTGQSLSFPFAHGHRWRYVFLVAVIIGVVQLLGSFFIKEGEKEKSGEDEPLLGETVEPLSIKGLLSSSDPKIRRACESRSLDLADGQSLWSSLPRSHSRHAVFRQSCTFRPEFSSRCSMAILG
jgi:MFS family permease